MWFKYYSSQVFSLFIATQDIKLTAGIKYKSLTEYWGNATLGRCIIKWTLQARFASTKWPIFQYWVDKSFLLRFFILYAFVIQDAHSHSKYYTVHHHYLWTELASKSLNYVKQIDNWVKVVPAHLHCGLFRRSKKYSIESI